MLKAKMIHHCLDAFLHCSRSPEQHSAVVKTKKVQLGKGAMCMHGLPQNQRFLKVFSTRMLPKESAAIGQPLLHIIIIAQFSIFRALNSRPDSTIKKYFLMCIW